MEIKKGVLLDERYEVIKWAFKFFKDLTPEAYFFEILDQITNWDISVKLIDENDKLMGLYLLGNYQIDSIVQIEDYKELKGVEGVLLAVDESIRGQGWGNKLKDYPSTLGYDYIWGQQLISLNNLEDWLKRRVLIATTKSVYVTLERYKK